MDVSSCEEDDLCSADLALATWSEGPESGGAGYDLEAGEVDGQAVVLVGAPNGGGGDPAAVAALAVADLGWYGTWDDDDPSGSSHDSSFGVSIAIAPDADRFLAGAPEGAFTGVTWGAVYQLDRLPSDHEAVAASLVIHGTVYGDDGGPNFGVDVAYLDLGGEGADIVVGANSSTRALPGRVFRFDPELSGEHDDLSASATLTGSPRLGQHLAGWDGDGDGLLELVSSVDDGVAHFPAQWLADRTEADADLSWTDPDPTNQLGEPTERVGDLDGDGRGDLALGAQTHTGTDFRTGALYLVPAGPLTSSPASELPYRFFGTEFSEALGSSATSGDYDGDGETDLVIGAYGVNSGELAGKVLGYRGPLDPGTRTGSDADFVVHGENVQDWFGTDAVTVDADGDARADLVVGAQGANQGRGEVYLFLGADLMP